MNFSDILDVAMAQSAVDLNCKKEDFQKNENVFVTSKQNEGYRAYLALPMVLNIVSYGKNAVVSVCDELKEIATKYVNGFELHHLFEVPNLHILDDMLTPLGYRSCFMAEYFLPKSDNITLKKCDYKLKPLYPADFTSLYTDEWSNALCKQRKHLDVLGVGAYDGDKLIGLSGCSADCRDMYQIGVDVLPMYRGKGVATALTTHLARLIFSHGKIPFYCAAWSNIPSVRNAIASGFSPAWVELTSKDLKTVDSINDYTKKQ